MEKKIPLIIDFDPGLDDAVCFFMIAGSGMFDILGACPVCGNKGLEYTESNALKLCELIGRTDIPVLKGAKKAILKGKRTSGNVHGATGLGGNVVLPDPVKKVEEQYAWDFVHEQALKYPGELQILAVGPLTNLGIALLKYPDLPKLVKRIVIMGGAFNEGNWTDSAEFNIWADPDAAKLVFNSGIPMAMMGLEICHEAYITKEDLARLDAGGRISKVAADLIRDRVNGPKIENLPEEMRAGFVHRGGVVCDAVSAAYMIDPGIFETEAVGVDVETKGGITEGRTVAVRPFTETVPYVPNTLAGVSLDREAFADLVVRTVAALD